MTHTIDLTGKNILVTGASRGIGRAIALALGGAGATIGVNYVRSADKAREVCAELGDSNAIPVEGDIANPAEVEGMIESFVATFGSIDVLVNNAGVFEVNHFEREDYEGWQQAWRRTFDVNIFGAANAAWVAMRQMRKQGGGKIINVASRAAYRGETEFADYGASKAALVNLTISIARRCAKDGITANAIAPGFIATDMASSEIEAHRDELEAQVPLGAIGEPEDVANVALFLASPLSDYINGACLDVNGGSWFH